MEPSSDPADSYAGKFLAGKTIFPDDGRIFHRPEFQYDDAAALGEAVLDGAALQVALIYRSGAQGELKIRPVRPGVLRIQAGPPGAVYAETSPMLLPQPEADFSAELREADDRYTYCYDGYTLELDKSPFCMRVRSPEGRLIFESETEKLVGLPTAPPLGLRRRDGNAGAYFSWRMRNQDHFFGLGEKFTRFEKRGVRATIWQADTCGSNTTDMSYKAVPLIYCDAGWGLLLHSAYRSYWELGSFSYATGSLLVEEEQLDLFLLLAPTVKEQVKLYTALTGRPSMPPRWAFGVWMSRAAYRSRQELQEVAERLQQEQIPCDVLNIDPTWMERGYYDEIGVEVCNFNWDAAAWGAPETLFRAFAARNLAICLWINPYFSEDSPAYQEALARGFLVRGPGGRPARLEMDLAAGIVDFTNPAAKAWWQQKLLDLLRKGAATFKVDFGDRVPEDAIFFNGKTGREMHNLYVHLYAEAVFEVIERLRGSAVIWRRPGYIGSQRYPGCWAGDTQVTWEGMAGALRGGLSAALSGESFWSHDIGGFVGGAPSPELYIRWAQWGLLSPFARFHGTTPREPWRFSPEAVEVVRSYAGLRYALLPYLLACAGESVEQGLPILRPLALEFPTEPGIETIDDQYMLGPDLLVAPVMEPGATTRQVYFPAGQWWPIYPNGGQERGAAPVSGPGYREVAAPLERLPLYAREGAAIPRYRQAPLHLKGSAPREWQIDLYPGDSQRRLEIHEPGFRLSIDYQVNGGGGQLELSPAPVTIAVRLIGSRQPSFLRAQPGTALQTGDTGSSFILDASQGVRVEFRL